MKPTTAVILAGVLTVATACTSGSDAPESRADVDARSYFDEYASTQDDSSGGLMEVDGTAGAPRSTSSTSDRLVPCNDCEPTPPRIPPRIPPIDAGNTFRDAGTSTQLDPAEQPQSTFALDVDTGSYRVAQQFLSQGTLPPPASVRPEEWINAYDYDDPEPTDGDLGVSVETGATSGDSTQLFRVAVGAREQTEEDRPPASVTFVVDTSGSMDIRDRLGLAKSSLALLAKNLRPDDKISIVTYDDRARSVLEPTPVADTDTILSAIDGLEPGGGTNLQAGVEMGYEYAERSATPGGINAVVLASDGVANIGLTDPTRLADQVNTAATKDDIHLVTVGYGMGNYNDHLMEQLADQGQGFYSYVSTFDDAQQLYGEDLTSTLGVVAADAKAQVAFDPRTVESYRLIGYENRALSAQDFDDASTDAGEVGAGMTATALYQVTPSPDAAPGAQIGTATVRWASVPSGEQHESQAELRIPDFSGAPPADIQLAYTVADFAETIKHQQGTKALDFRLHELSEDATELADDDVAGAEELASMIDEAIDAHPSGGGAYEIQ